MRVENIGQVSVEGQWPSGVIELSFGEIVDVLRGLALEFG